jgi:hypothetical protein
MVWIGIWDLRQSSRYDQVEGTCYGRCAHWVFWKVGYLFPYEEMNTQHTCLYRHILAIGLENGHVLLYSSPFNTPNKWTSETTLDSRYGFAFTHVRHWPLTTLPVLPPSVTSIGSLGSQVHQPANRKKLAMCSEDRTVRILEIEFKWIE